MIIGIDTNQANKTNRSGVEWYSFHVIEHLKKVISQKNITVRLYSQKKLVNDLSEVPDNWEKKTLPWLPTFFWNMWTQLRLSFELLIHPPDVFFTPGYAIPLVHPKKSVVVIHDLGFLHHPEYYSLFHRYYYRLLAWFSLNSAWQVITPSQFTKQDIIAKYSFPGERIHVIPLGYDRSAFHPGYTGEQIQRCLDAYQITQSYICYLGRLTTKKNILGVVEAFHRLIKNNNQFEDVMLVLAGEPQEGWDEVKKYINQNNLSQRIKQTGYVREEDKPLLLAGAQIFLFPSFFEGFGLPVIEAMACGTPVITANTTSLSEVAGEAAILIDPSNTEAIAEELQKLLGDNNLQKILTEKGLNQVKNFSWTECASKTFEVLCKDS